VQHASILLSGLELTGSASQTLLHTQISGHGRSLPTRICQRPWRDVKASGLRVEAEPEAW